MDRNTVTEKTCSRCRETKQVDDFGLDSSRKDGKRPICKVCQSKIAKDYYERNRDREIQRAKEWQANNPDRVKARTRVSREVGTRRLIEYLLDHPCVDCGETDILTLEFDHVDGSRGRGKYFGATKAAQNSEAALLREIEDTEVVCGSCHNKRTHTRAQSSRFMVLQKMGLLS